MYVYLAINIFSKVLHSQKSVVKNYIQSNGSAVNRTQFQCEYFYYLFLFIRIFLFIYCI